MGQKQPCSTTFSPEQETIAGAFRRHVLLPFDDCHYAQQATIPQLTHATDHRLTKSNHPWANGQVERMDRTIKKVTVRTCHCEDHVQLRDHLAACLNDCKFANQLEALAGKRNYTASFPIPTTLWDHQTSGPTVSASGVTQKPTSRAASTSSALAPAPAGAPPALRR